MGQTELRLNGVLGSSTGLALVASFTRARLLLRWGSVNKRRRRSMSTEENKAIARRWAEEVWSEGNLGRIEELVLPDYVEHDPAVPEEVRGPEGVRRYIEEFRRAFPDMRLTVEDQVAEGDRVVTRWTARGTHRGEFMGLPASGNRLEMGGMSIDRFSGGRLVESWENYDALGMMRQIGALPKL
jgi:steroid delta-isomerase-like uncharacterized protein